MTALAARKTKLTFETADVVRDRGKLRTVVVEPSPLTCVLRLKGTRTTKVGVSWAGLYQWALKLKVEQDRAERKARRKGGRP